MASLNATLTLISLLLLTFGSIVDSELDRQHQPDLKDLDDESALDEIGLTNISTYLGSRLSQMKSESIRNFSRYIEEDTGSWDSKGFCKAGGFLCDPDVQFSKITIPPNFQSSILLTHHYFKKSDVLADQHIPIPHLQNDVPFKAFLPQALTKKFPLDSHFLPVLFDMLDIPPASQLAKYMEETVTKCEKKTASNGKKEFLKKMEFWQESTKSLCTTSLEEMSHFISQNLGTHLQVVQSSPFSLSEQNMTVKNISVIGCSTCDECIIICTDKIFPFSVFDCRVVENVETIEVILESDDEEDLYTAVMQCTAKEKVQRLNRRFLIPTMGADKEEEAKEGKVCHWLTQNDVVFVKKDKAEEKEEEEQQQQGRKESKDEDDDEEELETTVSVHS